MVRITSENFLLNYKRAYENVRASLNVDLRGHSTFELIPQQLQDSAIEEILSHNIKV